VTVLCLRPASGTAVDTAIAAVDRVVLSRSGGAAYAEVEAALVPAFVRALAFAGVRADACAADLAPPAGSLVARGLCLEPLAVSLDVVRLERVALGRDTRDLMRRRLFGILPPGERAREECRRLLRGDQVTFEWSRLVWGTRAILRTGQARRTLRPIVFSRAIRDVPGGRLTTGGDDIGRWLFA
jgi:hypothetical protein